MKVERKPTSKWCAKFVLTASHNTWSHQRRKRRRERQKASASHSSTEGPSSSKQPCLLGSSSGSSSGSETDEHSADAQTNPGESLQNHPSSSTTVSSGLVKETASERDTSEKTVPETSKDCQSSDSELIPSSHAKDTQPSNNSPSKSKASPGHGHSDYETKPPEPSSYSRELSNESKEVHASSEEGFPLEIHLDVKLGEKRAIVFEAKVMDSSQRNNLHQVVQYVKNQMKWMT